MTRRRGSESPSRNGSRLWARKATRTTWRVGDVDMLLLNGRKAQAKATGARVQAVSERQIEERRTRLQAARERAEERKRPRFDLPSAGLPAGRTAVEIEGVVAGFPGVVEPVLDEVSVRIVGPERVAVVGPNGSGKTTLLQVALSRLTPEAGAVRRLPDGEVAFLDQNGAELDPVRSVLENFRAFHPNMDPTAPSSSSATMWTSSRPLRSSDTWCSSEHAAQLAVFLV